MYVPGRSLGHAGSRLLLPQPILPSPRHPKSTPSFSFPRALAFLTETTTLPLERVGAVVLATIGPAPLSPSLRDRRVWSAPASRSVGRGRLLAQHTSQLPDIGRCCCCDCQRHQPIQNLSSSYLSRPLGLQLKPRPIARGPRGRETVEGRPSSPTADTSHAQSHEGCIQ